MHVGIYALFLTNRKGAIVKRLFAVMFTAILAVAATPVLADNDHKHDGMAASMADGEIRKVDKKAGTVTIKHGPIQAIDMPAMTMVFQVKEVAMLDRVKAGDKVKFQAEMRSGGKVTVTRIEAAK